jgi:chaperonin GroES
MSQATKAARAEFTAIEPLGDRVVIEPDEAPKQSKGGIFFPDSMDDKDRRRGTLKGTVLAVGPGRMTDQGTFLSTSLEPGDRVLFGPYFGNDTIIDEKTYKIQHESEILGKLPN